MKVTRVAPGLYHVVAGGLHYKVEEVSRCEGFPEAQWNISLIGPGDSIESHIEAFDGSNTFRGAKDLIEWITLGKT